MKYVRLHWFIVLLSLTLLASTASAQETIRNPKKGTPEFAIAQALQDAISDDFEAYLRTIHPDEKSTKTKRDQRKNYEWKRFKKQAQWYLVSQKPITFLVTSRRPDGSSTIRLFIKDQKHKESMPRPVKLKKTDKEWKITTNSL